MVEFAQRLGVAPCLYRLLLKLPSSSEVLAANLPV
jgi:hypothetical protein